MNSMLDQWKMLAAVVDEGSFAAAAERLGKSQSSVSYAVTRLQEKLGLPLTRVQGRQAVLTDAGAELLRRARLLIASEQELEDSARAFAAGGTAEIGLVVSTLVPERVLSPVLADFGRQFPHLRLELHEHVLSGVMDVLLRGDARLALASDTPVGFVTEPATEIRMLAVVGRQHPLRDARALSLEALRGERQIVVRDSGAHRRMDAGWLGARDRWTVGHSQTSVRLVRAGLGFAWLPEHEIERELREGDLQPLDLVEGGVRFVALNRIRASVTQLSVAERWLWKRLGGDALGTDPEQESAG